MSLLPGLQA